jgi:hypothetical protein
MESASDEEGEVRHAAQVGRRGEAAGDDASGYASPAGARDTGEDEGDGEGGPSRQGRKRSRAVQGTPRRPSRSAAAVDSRAGWSRVDPAGQSVDRSLENRP